jgi:ABC-type antimicrobial peptide transport system permease subunit
VSRRTLEIGLRMALGAPAGRVVRQIVGESLRVISVGVMTGWLLIFLVDLHLLRGVISLTVFAGVPALLLSVAAVACWIPARRAAMIDPLVALREE